MPNQQSAESHSPQQQISKLLILVRHAKSSWNHPHLNDFDRPLNPRGLQDAPEMGCRLASKYPTPDHFAASPAVRAWSTAKILAQAWNYPVDQIHPAAAAYEASPATLIKLVRQFPSTASAGAMAAHNPGITHVVNALAGSVTPNMPTCSVAVIRFAVDSWTDVREGEGELVEYDFPKNQPRTEP